MSNSGLRVTFFVLYMISWVLLARCRLARGVALHSYSVSLICGHSLQPVESYLAEAVRPFSVLSYYSRLLELTL